MDYEHLLDEAYNNKLKVRELELRHCDGKIKGNRIAIRKDLFTNAEKACVLAEELGHFHTTTGDILDQSNIANRKQEHKARFWAFDKQIGLIGIVRAYESYCTSLYEMSVFLDVSESFLLEALEYYKEKYGTLVKLDNYLIYFIPNLVVFKLL